MTMKQFLGMTLGAVALLLLAVLFAHKAHAQAERSAPYSYQALGYCQMTSVATAKAVATANCTTGSVPSGATIMEVCASSQGIRYRDDGTAPTASIGIPVASGTCFPYSGPIPQMQIIQQSASATVDITFYN